MHALPTPGDERGERRDPREYYVGHAIGERERERERERGNRAISGSRSRVSGSRRSPLFVSPCVVSCHRESRASLSLGLVFSSRPTRPPASPFLHLSLALSLSRTSFSPLFLALRCTRAHPAVSLRRLVLFVARRRASDIPGIATHRTHCTHTHAGERARKLSCRLRSTYA